MSYENTRASFDCVMEKLLSDFRHPDYVCAPRGSEIKENLGVTFKLINPRARLLSPRTRKTNYGFAVGEFLWYLRGSNKLDEMVYYNKRMKNFSDDGKTLNSAYGHRLRTVEVGFDNRHVGWRNPVTQWDICKSTLLEDNDSRRAVLHINQPKDQVKAVTRGSKDVPCTLSLQFFIRNNKLHLHAVMRSNDVHWGLTYDLFSFTMLQECMLLELKEHIPDLELGHYYHTAGSLHIYDRHYDMSQKMLDEYNSNDLVRLPQMAPIEKLEHIDILLDIEKELREGNLVKGHDLPGAVGWMAEQLFNHRMKRDKEKVQ